MSNGPARRQFLKATAVSGIVAPVAGCIDTLETEERTPNPSSDDEPGSGSGVVETACDVGEAIVAALGDGDFETAASYYPYEYAESEEKADITAEFEDGRGSKLGWMKGAIEDISCECSESPADTTAIDDEFAGELTDVREVRYSVTHAAGDGVDTEPVFVNAFEIEGEWYGRYTPFTGGDRCGIDGGDGADEADDGDQPLDPADWEDVDEIVLEGTVANWVGVEPAPIETVENPTLLLFEGREYTIEWRNVDGRPHNLQIRDEDGDGLAKTDFAENEGETVSTSVAASAAMDGYVCEPHESTMVGSVVVQNE